MFDEGAELMPLEKRGMALVKNTEDKVLGICVQAVIIGPRQSVSTLDTENLSLA